MTPHLPRRPALTAADLAAWQAYETANARARRLYRLLPSRRWCDVDDCWSVARFGGFCTGHKALRDEHERTQG